MRVYQFHHPGNPSRLRENEQSGYFSLCTLHLSILIPTPTRCLCLDEIPSLLKYTMVKHTKDPFAEREAQKYDYPIPSREYILQILADQGAPQNVEELALILHMHTPEEMEALQRRLNAMERDGQLLRNRRDRYCLINRTDLIAGRVIGHPDGFGFLRPDTGNEDIYLSSREMRALIHGDRAVVCIRGLDRRGRKEGSVVEVLERNTHKIVGRFYTERGISFIVPDSKYIPHEILIPERECGKALPGQIVVAELVEQPSQKRDPIGKIVQVLGEHMAPGLETDMAIHSFELPNEWPESVLAELSAFTTDIPEQAKVDRVDIRHLPLVTIDGEDARDFDDAVYCERTARGWTLYVAIADVSYYVQPGTAMDEEAKKRGNSVYFPNRVIPMLPELLSNILCSLNPHEDRLCMVCEMAITPDGTIQRAQFFSGWMHSKARFTYTEVASILLEDNKELRHRYRQLIPELEELHALYRVLRRAREKRGAIEFTTQESKIVFGEEKKIEKIVPVVRNDAHRLIEECMLAANTAAAHYLVRSKLPHLLRVHQGPPLEKLTDVRTFLGRLGLSLGGGDTPSPMDYSALTDAIIGRPDEHLIQTVLLRSMSQAAYTPEKDGHFGLSLETYTHFTSPIRRYPDLLVHRTIRHLLERKKKATFPYSYTDMLLFGEHCSFTERRADEATRHVIAWLKCEYMQNKLGETFSGVISSVTSFGFFVELKEIFIEGLVHVSTLDKDYFHYDPVEYALKGQRTGKTYRLGDVIHVIVSRVDLDERKIDLDIVKPPKGKTPRKRKAKKRGV